MAEVADGIGCAIKRFAMANVKVFRMLDSAAPPWRRIRREHPVEDEVIRRHAAFLHDVHGRIPDAGDRVVREKKFAHSCANPSLERAIIHRCHIARAMRRC